MLEAAAGVVTALIRFGPSSADHRPQQQQYQQQQQQQQQQYQHQSLNGRSSSSHTQVVSAGAAGMQLSSSFHAEGAAASNGAFSPSALFEQRQRLLEEQVTSSFNAACYLLSRLRVFV